MHTFHFVFLSVIRLNISTGTTVGFVPSIYRIAHIGDVGTEKPRLEYMNRHARFLHQPPFEKIKIPI